MTDISYRSPGPESRMSTAISLYGGIASPSAFIYKKRPPNASPAMPQLSPSPSPRPLIRPCIALPYLSSPGTRRRPDHSVGRISKLGRIQRMAALHVTGAMHTTVTGMPDVHADLLPFPPLVNKYAKEPQ